MRASGVQYLPFTSRWSYALERSPSISKTLSGSGTPKLDTACPVQKAGSEVTDEVNS